MSSMRRTRPVVTSGARSAIVVRVSEITAQRSPLLAFVANLLVPGLGHLYVGHPRLALAMLLALTVVVQLLLVAPAALDLPPLWVTALALCAALGFKLALAADAWRRARRYGDGYQLRAYNRPLAYLGFLALSLVLGSTAHAVRAEYGIDTYRNPSGSMEPTLQVGDHFIVTKLRERARLPGRGDLIVFQYPDDPSQSFLKRVIGLPGDRIAEGDGGELMINGEAWARRPCDASEPPACFHERTPTGREYTIRVTKPAPRAEIVVPEGHVWVRGDNRSYSHDSAHFGPVPIASIEGRARAIFWPLARLGEQL